eukprot:scaffold4766_cov115-Isochrysis_galbana.AAC.9
MTGTKKADAIASDEVSLPAMYCSCSLLLASSRGAMKEASCACMNNVEKLPFAKVMDAHCFSSARSSECFRCATWRAFKPWPKKTSRTQRLSATWLRSNTDDMFRRLRSPNIRIFRCACGRAEAGPGPK